jgi:hypothetical protein
MKAAALARARRRVWSWVEKSVDAVLARKWPMA